MITRTIVKQQMIFCFKMKQIKGFPDYLITDSGRVWSNRSYKELKPDISTGYLRVTLYKDNKITRKSIHRLVLETFVGPCPPGMECRHLDGNPKNDKLENLRWGTKKENAADTIKHGKQICGEAHHSSKLTEQKVRRIVYRHKSGLFTYRKIAKIYGVNFATAYNIVNKKIWKHLWNK